MRKVSLAVVSGAALALVAATPAFAFTSYASSASQNAAANFSDPDAQFDQLAGSDGGDSSGVVQFGGSAMDADAARTGLSMQNDDKDTSYSGFYIPNN
jgi:hypothetical protein